MNDDDDCLVDENGRAHRGALRSAIIAGSAKDMTLVEIADKHGFCHESTRSTAVLLRKQGHAIVCEKGGRKPWLRRIVLANAVLRDPLPSDLLAERHGISVNSVRATSSRLRKAGHAVPRFNKARQS